MHNSNQHHSFINLQVAELLSSLAISNRSTLSGSTVKCCSGSQQNFYFATANLDDFLNLADTLAIRSMASDVTSAQLQGWSKGSHLVSYRWGRIKKHKIFDGVFIGCL